MKTLETERLILREFREDDFEAVHSYASCAENIIYMPWGPNTEVQTRAFIGMAISKANQNPCTNYQFAVVLKSTNKLIGACNLARYRGDEAEIGWILHRDYWKQGYGTEMGKALLEFGFQELSLRRVFAFCDDENIGSCRVMEEIGMRREGLYIEGRPAHKLSDKKYGDELSCAILRDEWETHKEIAYYNAMPVKFDSFIDLPELSDGVVYLVCMEKRPERQGNDGMRLVPEYDFAICRKGEKIGNIRLRIGYVDSLYYGGQIGYDIDEKHRGNGYAARACRLLAPVARAHGMTKLLITNNYDNTASKRVCEKLGARLVRVARLPEWDRNYKEGIRYKNIYEWSVE